MNIHFISPFDKIAKVVLNESILGRAEKKNIVRYNFYNLFEYADPHTAVTAAGLSSQL